MLGEIAFPQTATLLWMGAAAALGAGFSMLGGIRQRYYEWRIARRRARGEDAFAEEWEASRYDPHALTEEERHNQPVKALVAGTCLAIGAWVWREFDQNLGELLFQGAIVAGALVLLLRDMGKTDEELGIERSTGDPMKGPPGFLDRHGKHLRELGGAMLLLGMFVLLGWPETLLGERPDWLGYVVGAVILAGIFALVHNIVEASRTDDSSGHAIDDSRLIGIMFAGFVIVFVGIAALVMFA